MTLTVEGIEVAVRTYDSPTVAVGVEDLLELVRERDRLMKQVDELQAEATKAKEATLARCVRAFHAKFGHPIAHTPRIPSEDRVRFRAKLINEEYLELLDALFILPNIKEMETIKKLLRFLITECDVAVDLPEAMDALADLDYVIEGTRVEFGVDGAPLAAEVQRANLSKDPNGPDGKPVKPPTWTPPDIVGCLREQGWNPYAR